MSDSRVTRLEALPSTYSGRVKGRERYSGNAPLTRSGETSTGATQAVSRKASAPWKVSAPKKNSACVNCWLASTRTSNSARAAVLCAM